MKNLKSFSHSNQKTYLYTLLFTSIVLAFLIFKLKLYPFGDQNLRYADGDQYFGFYSYFQQTFFSKSDLLYSWSKVLGGGMISTYAYYAASPFNLLLLLFKSNLALGVNVVATVKLFLTSLSFASLLNANEESHIIEKALFSTSYAFMGYAMYFAWNGSWMDGVLILPLLVLGMQRMLLEKKPLLYVLSLTFALLSNFYIGYMLSLSTGLFYLFYLVEEKGKFLSRLKASFLTYIGHSLLAVGLAMGILLPTYFGLPKGRAFSPSHLMEEWTFNFDPLSFLSMFYSGALRLVDKSDNLPVIFVGVVPFSLLLFYFLTKEIRLREKILSFFLLMTFYFSFDLNALNIIWHGFSDNKWFNYRYSFIFSFLVLILVFRGLIKQPKRYVPYLLTGLSFWFLTGVIFYHARPNFSLYSITADVFFVFIALIGLYIMSYDKKLTKRLGQGLLIFIMLSDLGLNGWSLMREGVSETSVSDYQQQTSSFKQLISAIKDKDFYRIGNLSIYGRNNASEWNYAGISNYASTEELHTLDLVKKLGLGHTWMWGQYSGNTPSATDDLLSFRYVIARDPFSNKTYPFFNKEKGLRLYQNSDALPLIYGISSKLQKPEQKLNDFDFQNRYWRIMTSEKLQDVFTLLKVDQNIRRTTKGQIIKFSIPQEVIGRIYFQLPENAHVKIRIKENHQEFRALPFSGSQEIYYAGEKKASSILQVRLDARGKFNPKEVYVAVENEEAKENYLSKVEDRPFVQEITSSHLSFMAKPDQLYTSSIPYDPSWKIIANDSRLISFNNGGFLAFKTTQQTKRVELTYVPKGLFMGLLISGLTFFYLLLFKWIPKR